MPDSRYPIRTPGVIAESRENGVQVTADRGASWVKLNQSAALVYQLCSGLLTVTAIQSELENHFGDGGSENQGIYAGEIGRTIRACEEAGLIEFASFPLESMPFVRVAFMRFPPHFNPCQNLFVDALARVAVVVLVPPGSADVVFDCDHDDGGEDVATGSSSLTVKIAAGSADPDETTWDFLFSHYPRRFSTDEVAAVPLSSCFDPRGLDSLGSARHYSEVVKFLEFLFGTQSKAVFERESFRADDIQLAANTPVKKLILRNFQSPGDITMLTAAVRDLHRKYPGHFVTDVRTSCPQIWERNPYISEIDDDDPDAQIIDCEYPLIHYSNVAPYHFIHGFIQFLNQRLGLSIEPTEFRGFIRLSEEEKKSRSLICREIGEDVPYWIVDAGGKLDYTTKWWDVRRYQEVIDAFSGKILFVQVGEAHHYHPELHGCLNLVGKTDLRELILLFYHAQGVLTPVSLPMHFAAAIECPNPDVRNRPCVVVAGGREPAQWEAYPHHQFIHMNGTLPCCSDGGCWKSRTTPVGDGDEKDRAEGLCVDVVEGSPRCMHQITSGEVIRRISLYFEGGVANYLTHPQAAIAEGYIVNQPLNARRAAHGDGFAGSTTHRVFLPRHFELHELTASWALSRVCQFLPDYPRGYSGRGIVIPGGGEKYLHCAWVAVNMLRYLGCELPIELWYLGPDEVEDSDIRMLSSLGVKCIDALAVSQRYPSRTLRGWELKPYSIIHSSFREVLFLDADNVPIRNPVYLFDSDPYLATGAVFWPDDGKMQATDRIWKMVGIEGREDWAFETGQMVIDKERCWKELVLTMWFNEHSDLFYRYVHGDKETFHLAWRKLGTAYAFVPHPLQALHGTMCQHDFDGRRLFQHRNFAKWVLHGRNDKVGGFKYESQCLTFLDEFKALKSRRERRQAPCDRWNAYFDDKVSSLGARKAGFVRIFDYLSSIDSPKIVETGACRNPESLMGDGCSTLLFDHYVGCFGGSVTAIDSDSRACEVARGHTKHARIVCGDSVSCLAGMTESVDLLYLDSMDVDWQDDWPSASHHLKEVFAARHLLKAGSLIVVDDNSRVREGDRTRVVGKGRLISEVMTALGLEPYFHYYQVAWLWGGQP